MPGAHILERAIRPHFGSGNGLVLEHACCACVNDHSSAHLALEPAWGGGEIGTFWHVPRMVLSWSMRADVGGVGCPDLGGSPSRASGEVDRVSGQHCSGDTRGCRSRTLVISWSLLTVTILITICSSSASPARRLFSRTPSASRRLSITSRTSAHLANATLTTHASS